MLSFYKSKEVLVCLLTKWVKPAFGDNVVNCSSKKLVFRKQIGEDFSIWKPVYGDLWYVCRHPNKLLDVDISLGMYVAMLHLLWSNFKVELWWVLNSKSNQFFCVTPCVSLLRGRQHAMCLMCMWACAHAVLWRHVPKLAQSNWRNSGATSKWNYDGFRWPNWLKFFCVTLCVSPLRGW